MDTAYPSPNLVPDVDDRQELLAELEHLRFMRDASPQAPWTADETGRVTWISRRWQLLTGTPPETAHGRGFLSFVYPDDRDGLRKAFHHARASHKPFEAEVRIRTAEGFYRWMRTSAVPRLAEDGAIRWYGFTEDVHDRVLVQRRADEAVEDLRRTQEALSLALKGGRMGWWIRSLETNAVSWSPELEEIFGFSPGAFAGTLQGFNELVHPEDLPGLRAAVASAIENRTDYVIEFRFRRRDGSEGWMEGRGRSVYAPDGRPLACYGVGIDVTERHERQRTLDTINRLGGALAANLDLDLVLRTLTEACIELTGATFGVFVDGGSPDRDVSAFASLLSVPVTSRSGEPIGRLLFGHPAPGAFSEEHQKTVAALASQAAIAIDNAQLYERSKGMNEELERRVADRTAQLRASNVALEGFAHHVAHDLRAPLRSIVLASRTIEEEFGAEVPPEALDMLHRQERAAKRLAVLIDDLLEMARLSRTTARRRPADLSEIVKGVAEEALTAHPGTLVQVRVEEGLRLAVDPGLLRLALGNLVENAVKYSPDGGIVRVGRREDGAFFVSDEGIGIESQYFERIFEPFQRLHGEGKFKGTGIGLSNVRQIVTLHGGRVWVESEPNAGSTFLFTLE